MNGAAVRKTTVRQGAVVAAGALLLGGCASAGAASGGAPKAQLTVHVGLFGGPMTRSGHMALSNAPAPGQRVTIVASDGSRIIARTDADGLVHLELAAGRYEIASRCGAAGTRHVVLRAGAGYRVHFDCDVP